MRHVGVSGNVRYVVWKDAGEFVFRRWRWWSPLDWMRLTAARYRARRYF